MTQIDPERQKQAKQYARFKRRLWVVDQAFSLLYALLWLATGWATSLRDWLYQLTDNDWLLVAGFIGGFAGLMAIFGGDPEGLLIEVNQPGNDSWKCYLSGQWKACRFRNGW